MGLSSPWPSHDTYMSRQKLAEIEESHERRAGIISRVQMAPNSGDVISEFYQILKEKVIPIPYKLPKHRGGRDTSQTFSIPH